MKFPRFWAYREESVESPDRGSFRLRMWGWSDRSESDAGAAAERRLAEIAAKVRSGEELRHGYFYGGDHPVREEILEEFSDSGDDPQAVVTRNRYGALVLNTARVPFVDVDLPEAKPPKPVPVLRRLFGGSSPDPAAADREALDAIRSAAWKLGDRSFRVYRTAAGFRLLLTDRLLDPAGAETAQLMETFGADPLFAKLCRIQKSFRARLTPKPWRCGMATTLVSWPRPTSREEGAHAEWLAAYERAAAGRATCRLVEVLGGNRIYPEAEPVIELHDRLSRVREELPLA